MTESFNTTDKAVKRFRNAVMLEKIKGEQITKDYIYNLFIEAYSNNPSKILKLLQNEKTN